MKTLSNMMMSDFIEMSCGNVNVVKEKGEIVKTEKLNAHVKKLMFDYKALVNPVGLKVLLISQSDERNRLAKWQILKNCLLLLAIDGVDEVKSIMADIGYNVRHESPGDIESRVRSEMNRLKFEQLRANELDKHEETGMPDKDAVRSMFDKEIASLMAFYKMNIDVRNITASVYGNMVVMADKELKTRKQLVQNMKR